MRKTIVNLALGAVAGALLCYGGMEILGHRGEHAKEEAGHAEHGEEEGKEGAGHDEHGGEGAEPGAIPDSLLARAGIALDTVRATGLPEVLTLPGSVRVDPVRTSRVAARFSGLVRELRVKEGDRVKAGDLIARLESDASLEPLELRAPRSGTVVRLDVAVGQAATAGQVLAEIADLGTVLVEFKATPSDMVRLRPGQAVVVRTRPEETGRRAAIVRIAPGVDRATQMRTLQVYLPNPGGELGEGLFVQGSVEVGAGAKGLSVPAASLQSKSGKDVVYLREGGRFEERFVSTGRRGVGRVEILSGLKAGEVVAAQGSFVVKADLGKGEAAHEH